MPEFKEIKKHLSGIELKTSAYPCNDKYPFSLPIMNNTREVFFDSPVTIFVGENGSGKSTLLSAIARACQVHIWSRDEGGHFQTNKYEKELGRYIKPNWTERPIAGAFFGSEMFNDFRKIVDGWAASDPGQLKYFGGKSLLTQSHGQSIMSYFESRYKIEGLYFLDEPETALSPKTQLKLVEIMEKNIARGGVQFIVATHSPILMGMKYARLFSFNSEKIEPVDYKDTEHYQIYKEFFS